MVGAILLILIVLGRIGSNSEEPSADTVPRIADACETYYQAANAEQAAIIDGTDLPSEERTSMIADLQRASKNTCDCVSRGAVDALDQQSIESLIAFYEQGRRTLGGNQSDGTSPLADLSSNQLNALSEVTDRCGG